MDDPRSAEWQAHNDELINCRKCPRLVAWREEVAVKKRAAYRDWDYWGKPVPGLGPADARILVVGLAPAAHGGNRTGRVFTGDSSGDFLFASLYRYGFANQPNSTHRGDGLEVKDIFIAAICRCAPPDNKPLPAEILTCRPFLLREMELLRNIQGIVALGGIAFENVLTIYRSRGHAIPKLAFGHEAFYPLREGLPWLLASYHPSRQNTQTGRLTPEMFDRVWARARDLIGP